MRRSRAWWGPVPETGSTPCGRTCGKSIDDGSNEWADGDLLPNKRDIRAERGSGVNKWDFALFKNCQVREGKNVQFRGEMFNAFNHPSFTTVGRTLNTTATGVNPLASNFGVVTDTRDAQAVQFALKLTS
jgi:hypothetical protein